MFKATADHKVYVALCSKHPVLWDNGTSCSCPVETRSIERVKLSAVVPGMVLITPDRIAAGEEVMDPDRAWIEGLYIADGFSMRNSSFCISGQDGCPKEANKHRIKEICDRLGVATTWHRKYITIKDPVWTLRMHQLGRYAKDKAALSISLTQETAAALLDGIMADSGAQHRGNGRVFTTTSRALMLQTRLLHKMFGRTCSECFIVDHGGLGKNPIWRLGVRDDHRSDGHAVKLLRVKVIERDVEEMPVYDITTEDHYVYLPEADVTVSNCDGHNILGATLLALNGIQPKLRVTTANRGEEEGHVYVVAGIPKTAPNKWVALDTTLPGNKRFGYEVPYYKKQDFPA
jgi:hypothetical protein